MMHRSKYLIRNSCFQLRANYPHPAILFPAPCCVSESCSLCCLLGANDPPPTEGRLPPLQGELELWGPVGTILLLTTDNLLTISTRWCSQVQVMLSSSQTLLNKSLTNNMVSLSLSVFLFMKVRVQASSSL